MLIFAKYKRLLYQLMWALQLNAVSFTLGLISLLSVAFITNVTHVRFLQFFNGGSAYKVGCWTTLANNKNHVIWYGSSVLKGVDAIISKHNENFHKFDNHKIVDEVSLPSPVCLETEAMTNFYIMYAFFVFSIIVGFGVSLFPFFNCKVMKVFLNHLCGFVFPLIAFCYVINLYTYEGMCYPTIYAQVLGLIAQYGELDIDHVRPACVNSYIFVQILTFIIPAYVIINYWIFFKNKVLFNIQTAFCPFLLLMVHALYNYYIPDLYQPPATDNSKMVYRLVLHTCVMEGLSFFFRRVSLNEVVCSDKFGYMYMLLYSRFASMFSRFLINAVSDEVLQAVSAVVLGIIEVLNRCTYFYRDSMMNKLVSKIKGGAVIDNSSLQAIKVRIVIFDTINEIVDTIVMSGFFSLLLLPSGPLKYQINPKLNRVGVRMVGFHIESFIIFNGGIQLLIEFSTIFVNEFFDYLIPGVKSCDVLSLEKGKKSETFTFFALYLLSSIGLTYWFLCSVFMFPYKLAAYNDVTVGFDLQNTWINVMPNSIELDYLNVWILRNL